MPIVIVASCSLLRPSSQPFEFQPKLRRLGVRIVAHELRAPEDIPSSERDSVFGYRECARDLLSPVNALESVAGWSSGAALLEEA